MTSNILAGERRWASARRTGMTVLGKVAVPKPLNLPSQRLENHGLDPNVEIVPKGSIGWGSRPSSSASNPWGSATLSPNADGSASSPSQLSGRPSSAGSGSRPSTAGSDRTHERPGNAWGPSSRPSSASGVLASNQTSTSLRPHSAETRPNSSQLSRFAEPVSDSLLARGPIGTVDRVQGVVTSENDKNDRFSLISGDFPTLNSGRDSSTKNSEPQDHGSHNRPSSASGARRKEKAVTSQADVNSGTVNSWNGDGPQNADDGIQPSLTKWHGEPQQYPNANIPTPQFDAWRGPSMNAPAGVWYRGPPAGPPYGAPGGFPMEPPFPYYCPQIPPPALANSQPVRPPGAGPRGHHPKNGDLYRPQMPDAFVRPGMPFRPGFFPGPMPFEGYYGPPRMGYCNSNEREVPFKGMAGPSVYNRYSTPSAPDSGHSHARGGRSGSGGKMLSEHVEMSHSGVSSGQYKVLLKQHNELKGNEGGENLERMPTVNTPHLKKGGQLGVSLRREWGDDHESEEEMYTRRKTEGENSSSIFSNDQGSHDADTVKVKSFENVSNVVVDNSRTNQSVTAASSQGMTKPSLAAERGLSLPITSRDSTLMQKIEGLNVKVRASDGRCDGIQTFEREEQSLRSQAFNTKVNNVRMKAGNVSVAYEKFPASGNIGAVSHEMISLVGDGNSQPTLGPRKPFDHMHGKSGDNDKGRFLNSDGNGWQKKPVAVEPSNIPSANILWTSNVHATKIQPTVAATENPAGKSEGESSTELLDSTDSQAQRAKMREFAKQRATQLQKEEEERIREQKAKASAKLEELNRRTKGGNALNAEKAPVGVTQHELEEQQTCSMDGVESQALKPALASNSDVTTQAAVGSVQWGDESSTLASNLPSDRPEAVQLEPIVLGSQSLLLKQEFHNADSTDCKAFPQIKEGGASRYKRNNFKPKQNAPQQKNICDQSEATITTKAQYNETEIASNEISVVAASEVLSCGESNLPRNPIVVESSVQQRRKNNKSSKKHKADDTSFIPALPSTALNESNPVEACTENEISKAPQLDLDSAGSVQEVITTIDGAESSKQHSSLHAEEAHGRVSNHRKPQHSRRFARNQQSNRVTDKFHGNDTVRWAPFRSQNKTEHATEMSQQTLQESLTSAKSDNHGQSNSKSKRAEMERYVPKPVAKELAQQGSTQQPVLSSIGLSPSDEFAEREESGLGLQPGSLATRNVASTAESREVDSRLNKQVKALGAWHQRGSTEAPQNGSSSSTPNSSKNAQASVGQNQSVKPGLTSAKVEGKVSRDSNASDDWIMSNNSDAVAPVVSPVVRDQGVAGKGKRHTIKADKNMGFSHDLDNNLSGGEADRSHNQGSYPDIKHSENVAFSKESRGFEERPSPHWQPKSHSSSNNSQRGSRSFISQGASGDMGGVKKDYPSQSRAHVPPHVKENSEKDCQLDQSVSENKKLLEVANVGHQGHRKERKTPTSKGRPYSPNEGTSAADEPTYTMSADPQYKQHFPSDIKRSRNQHNHPGTSRESRGDWNQERHRHNIHYEYHPVGSHNNSKLEKFEDGSHNVGIKYKDRGLSQSKSGRGNFQGRQRGSIRVDAGSG